MSKGNLHAANLEATINLNQKIGTRIKSLRQKNHVTQAELAEALEVSSKHISAVERGLAQLSLERLIDVSFILDCSLEYLILGNLSEDVSARLPLHIMEILKRNDQAELRILTSYLDMFERIRLMDSGMPG